MKLDIANYEFEYSHDLEGYCTTNCILQLLTYHGVSNPYKYVDASFGLVKKPDITGGEVIFKTDDWNDRIRKNIITHNATSSYEEVWEENKKKVSNGQPIIVCLDVYMLPYSFNYHLTHSNHAAILCGYSDNGEDAYLIDWFEWKYKGILEKEHYRTARTSLCPKDEGIYSGTPVENKWYEVTTDIEKYDERQSLIDVIEKIRLNYYGGGRTFKDNEGSDCYGPQVLRQIYHNIFDTQQDMQSKLTMFGEYRRLCFRLNSCLKQFHYYISQSQKVFENSVLLELQNDIEKSIKMWDVILRMMLKCLHIKNETSFSSVSTNLLNAINMEERRIELISRVRDFL